MDGRSQFDLLQSNSATVLTLINVYAPTTSAERVELWNKLVDMNIPSDGYILVGDFNMVESVEDRLGSANKSFTLNRRELAAWARLLNHYGLEDSWGSDFFKKTSDLRFTWDNNRAGRDHRGACFDRIYISNVLCGQGGSLAIHQLSKIFDHAPVQLKLFSRGAQDKRQGSFKFSTLKNRPPGIA